MFWENLKQCGAMKKLITSIMAASFLLCGCQSFYTQEVKDGVSFAGLTKVYVERARGGEEVFNVYSLSESVNTEVAIVSREILALQGYQVVDNKDDAQIIFIPIWNVSYEPVNDDFGASRNMRSSASFQIGFPQMRPYATLEMQAWFPSRDEWVWRGFSAIQSTPADFGTADVKRHVVWCLQHFPPDKYPSSLEIYRKKQEAKRQEEENTFSHIVPENQAAAPSAEAAPSQAAKAQEVSQPKAAPEKVQEVKAPATPAPVKETQAAPSQAAAKPQAAATVAVAPVASPAPAAPPVPQPYIAEREAPSAEYGVVEVMNYSVEEQNVPKKEVRQGPPPKLRRAKKSQPSADAVPEAETDKAE